MLLKLSRQARGPIQVIFPEPAEPIVVRGTTKLTDAARVAGHRLARARLLHISLYIYTVIYYMYYILPVIHIMGELRTLLSDV